MVAKALMPIAKVSHDEAYLPQRVQKRIGQVGTSVRRWVAGEDRMVLRADEDAAHGDVVELIDIIKQSGFTRVSLSARVPAAR